MPATLKLTHKAIGAEVRRGAYDVVLDGERVGSVEMNGTIEIPVEPGRHTLQVRNGRNSSSTQTFDATEGEIISFRCTGKRFLPIFLASFVAPRLALKLVRDLGPGPFGRVGGTSPGPGQAPADRGGPDPGAVVVCQVPGEGRMTVRTMTITTSKTALARLTRRGGLGPASLLTSQTPNSTPLPALAGWTRLASAKPACGRGCGKRLEQAIASPAPVNSSFRCQMVRNGAVSQRAVVRRGCVVVISNHLHLHWAATTETIVPGPRDLHLCPR